MNNEKGCGLIKKRRRINVRCCKTGEIELDGLSLDLGMIGQVRPGDVIKFSWSSLDEVVEKYRKLF